jgi:peptide/nickel transport system substrate-binding protein
MVGLAASALVVIGLTWVALVRTAAAQETPRPGGELVFVVPADFHCSYIVEPDLALFTFQSADVSHVNYSRYTDRTLDDLYQRQSRATDREERRRAIRDFEKRLLDDEVHYIFTFQWHRIVPHNARLRGWTITPSHFLNNQTDAVWLTPE